MFAHLKRYLNDYVSLVVLLLMVVALAGGRLGDVAASTVAGGGADELRIEVVSRD